MIDPKVRKFSRRFFKLLEQRYWGDIPTFVFANIADGIESGEDMACGKCSPEEMEHCIAGMVEILTKMLKAEA